MTSATADTAPELTFSSLAEDSAQFWIDIRKRLPENIFNELVHRKSDFVTVEPPVVDNRHPSTITLEKFSLVFTIEQCEKIIGQKWDSILRYKNHVLILQEHDKAGTVPNSIGSNNLPRPLILTERTRKIAETVQKIYLNETMASLIEEIEEMTDFVLEGQKIMKRRFQLDTNDFDTQVEAVTKAFEPKRLLSWKKLTRQIISANNVKNNCDKNGQVHSGKFPPNKDLQKHYAKQKFPAKSTIKTSRSVQNNKPVKVITPKGNPPSRIQPKKSTTSPTSWSINNLIHSNAQPINRKKSPPPSTATNFHNWTENRKSTKVSNIPALMENFEKTAPKRSSPATDLIKSLQTCARFNATQKATLDPRPRCSTLDPGPRRDDPGARKNDPNAVKNTTTRGKKSKPLVQLTLQSFVSTKQAVKTSIYPSRKATVTVA